MCSEYLRDGRSPIPEKDATSRSMRSNKGKDTGPELMLRHALRERGHAGYRLNWKKAPGRPDICFVGKKIAIFVNGCFWHRCPKCNLPLPKTNTEFWINKFKRNEERDRLKEEELKAAGWRVITVWECEIRENVVDVAEKISNNLKD